MDKLKSFVYDKRQQVWFSLSLTRSVYRLHSLGLSVGSWWTRG